MSASTALNQEMLAYGRQLLQAHGQILAHTLGNATSRLSLPLQRLQRQGEINPELQQRLLLGLQSYNRLQDYLTQLSDTTAFDLVLEAVIQTAAATLAQGGLILYPTETCYGIAAQPWCTQALQRLLELKQRDAAKGITLIAADWATVAALGPLPAPLLLLAQAFWPGPLTLVYQPLVALPLVTPVDKSIAVRISNHPWAQALAQAAGGLITSTSANLTAEPPAYHLAAVKPRLRQAIDQVIDGGSLNPANLPSTLIGMTDGMVHILRQGAITASAIAAVVGTKLADL